ncbi:MAG: hypothetical protein IPN71_21570 [Fibrobacteres bacterium]|nr:hypothetical protein [Fibrobacterota bacterium]
MYNVVKAYYAKYFAKSESVCKETYNWQADEWVEIEINGCVVNLFQGSSSTLTEADRLNDIDLKGTAFIEGTAYRINSTGSWGEWQTFYRLSFAPPIPFRRKSGVIELQPDPGFSRIRPIP